MTDPAFLVAAYAVALGGLSAYAVSIRRRTRATRRTLDALTGCRVADEAEARERPASVGERTSGARP